MTPEQKIRFDKILANPDHKSIVECHEYAIYEAMDSYAQSQSIAFGVFCGFGSKAQLERLYSQFIEHQSKQV